MPDEVIKITSDELRSPQVEAYLEQQALLRRDVPEVEPLPLFLRIVRSSVFYLSVAGMLGAVLAWGLLEPFFNDSDIAEEEFNIANILMFPAVAAGVGLFLGAAEGIMCRNFQRAAISALVGLGIGFIGGFVLLIPAGIIFTFMGMLAWEASSTGMEGDLPTGFGLLLLIMGRGAAWAIAAVAAGIGQGIAVRDPKVAINGILGGVLGGLLGGLLFDPIYLLLSGADDATLSRGIGFAVIGAMVGMFVGLVEQWTKTAWLFMKAGPLAGKQFVLFRASTVIGSAPKSDIYLFKDPAIEPQHALIHNRGGRFEMEDCQTPDGTYVNGIPIRKQMLKHGDQIVIGKTVLEFSVKDS